MRAVAVPLEWSLVAYGLWSEKQARLQGEGRGLLDSPTDESTYAPSTAQG